MKRNLPVMDKGRIVFMDRFRLVLVLGVVLMHSAAAYTNAISWWSVQEWPKSSLLDFFVLFADGFQMPLFFFIAGYFAYYSMQKRSGLRFVISKFKRLGLPFIAIALFLNPYISYLGVRRVIPDSPGFFKFWIMQMKTLSDLTPVLFTDIETAMKHIMDYSLWHLWYIFVLMALYILYAGFNLISRKYEGNEAVILDNDKNNFIPALMISGIVVVFLYPVLNMYIKEWSWGKIGIFSVQPTRIPLYIVLFFLGVYGRSKCWFIRRGTPGRIWVWGTGFIIFSVTLFICMVHVFHTWFEPVQLWFSFVQGLIRTCVVISALGFFMSFEWWRREKSSVIDTLTDYSYEIYIIHLPIVIAFAKLFTCFVMPLLLKFTLVGCATIFISFISGKYLIRQYPKISTILITIIFVLMCIFLG